MGMCSRRDEAVCAKPVPKRCAKKHRQHKGKTASPEQVLCHDLCQIAHFYQNYQNRPIQKRKKPRRVFLTGVRAAAMWIQKTKQYQEKLSSKRQKEKPPTARSTSTVCGAPNRIRTCGLLIRSQTLYPAELWVRLFARNRKYYIKDADACQHFFSFFLICDGCGEDKMLCLSFLLRRGLPIAGNRGILFMK